MDPPSAGERAVPALRILHVVARSHQRGAEYVAIELADELDGLGHENRVLALGPAESGAAQLDVPMLTDTVGAGPVDLITRARRVRRLLADSPYDVVVAHGGWAAQAVALGAPRQGPAIVWQRIGDLSGSVWTVPRRWWWRAVARRFDGAVALTEDLAAEQRRLGFRGPIRVIPNFRRPDRFRDLDRREAASRLRSQLGLAKDSAVLALVGNLDRNKRVDRAISVQAQLGARGVDAHLVIVGDGPRRGELESQARALDVEAHVTFLGVRRDVEQVLAGADLLIITSDLEGIPGVAIEALMAGCPVVSVPVGGVAEVVEHERTGIVLPDADPERMAEVVAALLADEKRRSAMSAAGRAQLERFSAATAARSYVEHLAALRGDRRVATPDPPRRRPRSRG